MYKNLLPPSLHEINKNFVKKRIEGRKEQECLKNCKITSPQNFLLLPVILTDKNELKYQSNVYGPVNLERILDMPSKFSNQNG